MKMLKYLKVLIQTVGLPYYCSIALQMEHCFSAKMQNLNLIGNIYLNQNTLIKNIFLSMHVLS